MMILNPMPGPSRVPGWKEDLQEEEGLNMYLRISGDSTLGPHMDSAPESGVLSPGTLDRNRTKLTQQHLSV